MPVPRVVLTSLRVQLVLIPTAILLAGLIGAIAVIVAGASARVQGEMQSGMRLGAQLLADALQDVEQSADPERAYAALLADLPHVRHVIFVSGNAAPGAPSGLLAGLLAPTPLTQVFRVAAGGRTLGVITMRSNPSDEIEEIRAELFTVAGLLAAIWTLTILLIRAAVTRGLRPLHGLSTAIERLERGEAEAIPPIRIAELRRIGERFNSLSSALAEATADNRYLVERLMSAQEAERQELARELHDEIGPLLFGIRTDAACILRRLTDGSLADIPARARSLADYATALQRINSRMLERMRPLVLDEMGLAEALRALAAGWRARLPGTTWTADVPEELPEPDPAIALAAFRIVQEALTNAARHAGAHSVQVTLAAQPEGLLVSVRDDGVGLSRGGTVRRGYGLLGMAERARQAGGAFTARVAPGGGTLIEARLPMREAVACASC